MKKTPSSLENPIFITKKNFFDYFKKPYPFWFIQTEEIENFFIDRIFEEKLEEIDETTDLFELLREFDSKEHLLFNNFMKLSKILNEKLISFYRTKFKIPVLSIYDHSKVKEDKTDFVVDVLKNSSEAFIFNPSICVDGLKIKPTILYKHKGKIYLIEHFWSTSLKRETLGTFVFYNYVFVECLNLKIDQYFVSYLSGEVPEEKELKIEITNSIPFKTKKVYPTDILDPRLANVNGYFDLYMSYKDTLYEDLYSPQTYEALVSKEWPEKDVMSPKSVIDELKDFLENEDRVLDFDLLAKDFLHHKNSVIPSESTWFKFAFSNMFNNFSFSGTLIRFDKILKKISRISDQKERNNLLDYLSNVGFLKFPDDQDYLVFEEAHNRFETLKKTNVKVYYDFETISLPFPYLEKIKPYMQIVLQMSLIRTRDGQEEHVNNLIIDPLTIGLEDFKNIIDSIYVDEPGVSYIVYNKSFENSRLKEMSELIGEDEYKEKVISIIDRTVDLADWFSFGNKPHIIHKKLKGFHSIKKVTKLISKDIERRTGAVQYSDLKRCQNGIMAQALLLSRALSDNPKLDDGNWNKNKEFMYKYCENDVRSMIAVEFFIEELLKNNKHGFYDPKQYMKEKNSLKKMV